MKYQVRCDMDGASESFPIESTTEDEAIEEAEDRCQAWLEDGGWDTSDGTVWAEARWSLWVEGEGGDAPIMKGFASVTIHPDAPVCVGDHDHVWASPHDVVGGSKSNPGVHGHGGGVIIKEVCARCGAYVITDTWAQNPDTGEEGLRSVEYRDADEESGSWIEAREERLLERVERLGEETAREAIAEGWDSREDYELTKVDTDTIREIMRDLGDPRADDDWCYAPEGREVVRAFFAGVERVAADYALDAYEAAGEEVE